MPSDDLVDRTFDTIAQFFKELIDRDFQRSWFTWLEWVTVSAAIYGLGRKAGSPVLIGVALFSEILLFFTAWFGVERFVVEHLPAIAQKSRPVVFWLIVIAIALIPLGVIFFLAHVFAQVLK